jgi:hypothetical protein
MQVTTAEEIRAASRRGDPEIAGYALDELIRRPDWWEGDYMQLILPAARTLARVANTAARKALTAGPVLVGEIEEKPKLRAVGGRTRRPRALTAAR